MGPRRFVAVLLAVLLLGTAAGAPGALAAGASPAKPQVSFSNIQQDFMCTLCGEALNVARAPQAYSENATLRQLVAKGLTADQIKKTMVSFYGPAVLAKPPAHGFNLLVYVIPGVVVVAGLAFVGFTIPHWRRKSRERAAQPAPSTAALSDEERRRLDSELAQHL